LLSLTLGKLNRKGVTTGCARCYKKLIFVAEKPHPCPAPVYRGPPQAERGTETRRKRERGCKAHIEIRDKPIPPDSYTSNRLGPNEYQAIGEVFLQAVDRLGFNYEFDSIAAANAFLKAIRRMIVRAYEQASMRETSESDQFRLLGVDFETGSLGISGVPPICGGTIQKIG
jgi:hypothetical protein